MTASIMGFAGRVDGSVTRDSPSLYLVLSPDSIFPVSDLGACSAVSPDQEEDILLSVSGFDVSKDGHLSLAQPLQSVVFEVLLEVVMHASAKLNLNWLEEKVSG